MIMIAYNMLIIKQFPISATAHKHQNNLYLTCKYPMPFTEAKSWVTEKLACQTPTQQVVCVHDDMTLSGAPNMTTLLYTMLALKLASQCLYISGNIIAYKSFLNCYESYTIHSTC